VINAVDGQITEIKTKSEFEEVWLNIYPTKANYGLKVLTLGSDGSVQFTLKDQEMWIREEALSEVARVEIIDLPPDSNHNINPQGGCSENLFGI